MSEETTILYHYCSNRTLVNILKTNEIWLSDPRLMNDSQEFRHAGEIFALTFTTEAEKFRNHYEKLGYPPEAFNQWVAHVANRMKDPSVFPLNDRSSPYIFCLSSEWDSLSQWRAYGNGEFCIGFDREELRTRAQGDVFKVSYKKAEPDQQMASGIHGFFESHKKHIHGTSLETEVRWAGHEDFARVREKQYLQIKDKSFEDEKEWRLIKFIYPKDERVFFHDSGRYPVPRAKVSIFDTPESAASIVREIVCGPGADKERAEAAFEMIRRTMGIDPKIRYSQIPYRTT
jgi:hypothetical protein